MKDNMVNTVRKISPNNTAIGVLELSKTEYGEDNTIIIGIPTFAASKTPCEKLNSPEEMISYTLDSRKSANPDFVTFKELRIIKDNALCTVTQKDVLNINPNQLYYTTLTVNRKIINSISVTYLLK